MPKYIVTSFRSLAAALLFVAGTGSAPLRAAQAQTQSGFIELSWMKMKQDKVAEFGQLASNIADANRRGNGDHWIAYMDMYGTDNYVWMASLRPALGDVEPAMGKFMGALKEFMGLSPERFASEASKTVESSGTELWRLRFDLAWGVKDAGEWTALVAKAHYLAVVKVRVKPGHIADAEKQIGMIRDAAASREGALPASVAQVVLGGDPGTFYVRVPLESLEKVNNMPTPRALLGEEGYHAYSEMSAQNYLSVDSRLKRPVPKWSSPTAAFLDANPGLWKVKPSTATKPKPAGEAKPAAGQ